MLRVAASRVGHLAVRLTEGADLKWVGSLVNNTTLVSVVSFTDLLL